MAGKNTATAVKVTPQQLNDYARAMVLDKSIEVCLPVHTETINPSQKTQINITPRNVGLITKFIAVCTTTITNTDAALDAAITDFGVANMLSSVSFTDLNSTVRVQTSGMHLAQVYAAKYQWPLGAVVLPLSEHSDYGDFFNCVEAPSQIVHGAGNAKELRMIYEIPLAYSDTDLRGAVYANVVNAQMNLQLNINPTPCVPTGTDSTKAMYKGVPSANVALSNFKVEIYQVYLDQLPTDKNGVILPQLDLNTVYELKDTSYGGITANTDFPIPYGNLRDFLSTFVVYNSNPAADAGRTGGTDVNYFALTAANSMNIFKKTPVMCALEVRKLLQADLPKGCYYFSHRRKPISTLSYGNMELNLNPITAAAGANAYVGLESFAQLNNLSGASSLNS